MEWCTGHALDVQGNYTTNNAELTISSSDFHLYLLRSMYTISLIMNNFRITKYPLKNKYPFYFPLLQNGNSREGKIPWSMKNIAFLTPLHHVFMTAPPWHTILLLAPCKILLVCLLFSCGLSSFLSSPRVLPHGSKLTIFLIN